MSKARQFAIALAYSSAALTGLMSHEGFTERAVQPVPGDEWTYGYGSTYKLDGSPVRPNDTISKPEARTLMEIKVRDEYEAGLKRCAGHIPMAQGEYDAAINLAYNVGVGAVCRSSIIKRFEAGDYAGGCAAILSFNRLQGRKCSLPENRQRRDGCKGIMDRREAQYRACMGGS